jgi:hypothetical protein
MGGYTLGSWYRWIALDLAVILVVILSNLSAYWRGGGWFCWCCAVGGRRCARGGERRGEADQEHPGRHTGWLWQWMWYRWIALDLAVILVVILSNLSKCWPSSGWFCESFFFFCSHYCIFNALI